VKLIVKLALTALVLNATWQVGRVYANHYQFQDAVRSAALDRSQSDAQLQQRVLEIAAEHGVPLAEDGFAIRRDDRHTWVEGAYERLIPVAPGYRRNWRFTLAVDAYIIEPPKP
jgi:hypothetical protein